MDAVVLDIPKVLAIVIRRGVVYMNLIAVLKIERVHFHSDFLHFRLQH